MRQTPGSHTSITFLSANFSAGARDSEVKCFGLSGVVQLVARQPLELVILVRVQAPEPIFRCSIEDARFPLRILLRTKRLLSSDIFHPASFLSAFAILSSGL